MEKSNKASARGSFNKEVINKGKKESVSPEELHSDLYGGQEFVLKPAEPVVEEHAKVKVLPEEETPSQNPVEDNVNESVYVEELIKEGATVDEVNPIEETAQVVEEFTLVSDVVPSVEEVIEPTPEVIDESEVIEEGSEPLNEYDLEVNKNDNLPQYIKVSPLVTDEAVILIDDWNKLLREDKKKSESAKLSQKGYDEVIAGLEDDKLTDKRFMKELDEEYSDRHYQPLDIDEKTKSNRTDILNTSFNYIDEAFETDGTNKAKMFFTKDIPVANAQKNPVAFMDGIVGNAKPVEVVFTNSGFRASFRYPKKGRRKRFQDAVASLDDTIGAYLSTVSMDSFEYIRINELIVEMAKELLISSTLNSPDPLAYLTIEDLPILQAAILKSIFPNGLPFELMCMGNSILDPEKPGKTLCNKVEYGTVDPQQFIYTELPKLSDLGKDLISRTGRHTVTVKEVETLLLNTEEYVHTFDVEDNEIKLTFKNVLFSAAKDVGHAVLDLVKKDVMDNFDEGSDKDEEELFKEKISTNAIKNNVFLTKVEAGGRVFDNPIKDIPVVNALVESPFGLNGFYDGLSKYRETRIVKAGIPAYTCGCGTLNGQHLGLRPINLVRLFTVAVMVKI